MANFKPLLVLGLVLAFSAAAFAATSCSANAYRDSCSQCSFDASGRMDSSCSSAKQAGGVACLTGAYPVTYTKYAAGNCSGIDDCISELNTCKAQYSSGNDSEDCREGSVSVCFAAADQCVNRVAATCEGVENPCGGTTALIILGGIAALGFAAYSRR